MSRKIVIISAAAVLIGTLIFCAAVMLSPSQKPHDVLLNVGALSITYNDIKYMLEAHSDVYEELPEGYANTGTADIYTGGHPFDENSDIYANPAEPHFIYTRYHNGDGYVLWVDEAIAYGIARCNGQLYSCAPDSYSRMEYADFDPFDKEFLGMFGHISFDSMPTEELSGNIAFAGKVWYDKENDILYVQVNDTDPPGYVCLTLRKDS